MIRTARALLLGLVLVLVPVVVIATPGVGQAAPASTAWADQRTGELQRFSVITEDPVTATISTGLRWTPAGRVWGVATSFWDYVTGNNGDRVTTDDEADVASSPSRWSEFANTRQPTLNPWNGLKPTNGNTCRTPQLSAVPVGAPCVAWKQTSYCTATMTGTLVGTSGMVFNLSTVATGTIAQNTSNGNNLCQGTVNGTPGVPRTDIAYVAVCRNPAGLLYTLGGFETAADYTAATVWKERYRGAIYNGVPTGAFCAPTSGTPAAAGDGLVSLTWYSSSAASYRDQVMGAWVNPDVDMTDIFRTRTDKVCEDALGNLTTTSGEYVGEATYADPKCPAGTREVSTSWSAGPGAMVPTGGVGITPAARDQYPACLGVGSTGCTLKVAVDGTTCTVGSDICWSWQTLPRERTACLWGPYVMPLTDCADLGPAYRTGRTTVDPRTGTTVAAQPDGRPDPAAGPGVTTPPQTNPTPTPGPTTAPEPSTGPTPTTGPDQPQPQPNPGGEGSNCWAAMISWNPLDWVLTPVKCALQWAFVPPTGTLGNVMTSVGSVGPGPWVTGVIGIVDAAGDGPSGSCRGPNLSFDGPLVGAVSLYPFSACNSPVSTVAGVVKVGLTVMVWLGAGVVCIRLVGAAFGLNLNGFGGKDADA